MKKTIAILAVMFAVTSASAYGAPTPGVNLKIAGGGEDDVFRVTVSGDGRTYDIESNVALEADSSICWTAEAPAGRFVLQCRAPAIAGFEISGGGGDDAIELARVPVPATLSGEAGADTLVGGSAADRILGGTDRDLIKGNGGADELVGDQGADRIFGAAGDDHLRGGRGEDVLFGGTGGDGLFGGASPDRLGGGPGNDLLVGGPGFDLLMPSSGRDTFRQ